MRKIILYVVVAATVMWGGCKHGKKAQVAPQPPATEIITPLPPEQPPVLIGGYTKEQIYFKVQIGAFVVPVAENDVFFTHVSGEEIRIDVSPQGLYRYTVGHYNSYEQAELIKTELKRRGYADAFVVAYGYDDKRIEMPMPELLKLYNGTK
ncbi:SPOR domain-containing protein [Sphingobacteriales bacterium UPWRP_1]|nr:hypothetical protein BVG80_12310 [Sphingobacteriales bacterium TSM_CSM]PSJ73528.1 SPOR domain-containing protein [Sphingobacteriales bacterium UPWRP_1]